ncbi:hypothetical protein RHOSPDRAFT_27258 [Rhodotorula sp. JG-1b]|nr:hypothetical protein RHOSPDRAFT_27258 [Rhodotorula sp. JG-1b]
MLRSPTATASILRSVAARRTLTSTAAFRTTHPAHSSSGEQSVGQDMGEVKAKNSMVPVFMAIGAASVGYIIYAQMSAGQADRKAQAEAPKSGNDGPVAPVEQQSVGEDMQETQVKNATVPVLMAGGAVFVGYIIYSQVSAGKAAREEKSQATTDQSKSKPVAGEKTNTGTRG